MIMNKEEESNRQERNDYDHTRNTGRQQKETAINWADAEGEEQRRCLEWRRETIQCRQDLI